MLVDFHMPCPVCGDAFAHERSTFDRGDYLGGEVAAIVRGDDVLDRMRHVGKGTAPRDARKAERLGYTVREFAYAACIPEIKAIHDSKPIRGGRPMNESYHIGADILERTDRSAIPAEPPCELHNRRLLGAFLGDELRAYISLVRVGDVTCYARIIGHGDHLADGVMYLLHRETLVFWRSPVLMYGMWDSGGAGGGLQLWKRKNGFVPLVLEAA